MKKNIIISVIAILVIAVVVLLVATNKDSKSNSKLTVEEVYEKIKGAVSLPEEMVERNSADLDMRYGIDTSKASEYVFMANATSYYVDTIAIFKVENVDDREEIKSYLNNIKNQAMNSMNNYDAEQYKIASDGIVEVQGNYVYLIMTTDVAQVKSIIKSNI